MRMFSHYVLPNLVLEACSFLIVRWRNSELTALKSIYSKGARIAVLSECSINETFL